MRMTIESFSRSSTVTVGAASLSLVGGTLIAFAAAKAAVIMKKISKRNVTSTIGVRSSSSSARLRGRVDSNSSVESKSSK